MKLLPFNLQEALKQPDRVVYRNGEKPLQWHWLEKAQQEEEEECIVSVRPDGLIETHFISGRIFERASVESYDLFLLPPPEKRYWVSVYMGSNGKPFVGGKVYEVDPSLDEQATNYIKTISFTIQQYIVYAKDNL